MKVYVYNKEGNVLYKVYTNVNSVEETSEVFVIKGCKGKQRFMDIIDKRLKIIKIFTFNRV